MIREKTNMNRDQRLIHWLNNTLKTTEYQCVPLAGDASFRSYRRVYVGGDQYIVMDAPPPESTEHFVAIAELLTSQGLTVPKIVARDLEQGFLLLSDLGDRLYLNELNEATADALYQDAFKALFVLHSCRSDLPKFDRPFLQFQMGIFEEWYLGKNKSITVTQTIAEELNPVYERIYQVIERQPQVLVHRDYHSRNLMILEDNNPGILDFQDAIIGPVTYDLVSLLQDCYITWPRERVVDWVASFQRQAQTIGIIDNRSSRNEFLQWFDWTGLQRHLKNLGIFSRLHFRDNKSGYLKDIPRVLSYILETCQRYGELQPLQSFLETIEMETT